MLDNVVMSQVTAAGVGVALIQWFKNSPYFPWITKEKANLLRVAAVITSGLATIGISYTWNPEGRQLIFHIPTIGGIAAFGWEWIKSFVFQEITYQATAAKQIPGPPVAMGIASKAAPAK